MVRPGAVLAAPGFLLLTFLLSGCGDDKPEPPVTAQPSVKPVAPVDRSVVTYERGEYYTPSVSNHAARAFTDISAEEMKTAKQVRENLRGMTDIGEIQQQLAEARMLESVALMDVVDDLLAHQNPDVRTLALTLIEGINAPQVVQALRRVAKDPSDDVRIQVAEVAQHVVDPSIYDLLLDMMEDENISVRQLALNAARNQGEAAEAQAIARAATSPREDMAAAGLTLIEARPSKKTIDLVMRGLDHNSVNVRQQAHEMLFLVTHQSFNNAAAARAWWRIHQNVFDDDLVILDTEVFLK
jgi:HEAT repeat protein